ncbi:MAG: class I SAM-dependent methyltransferase [Candidatus Saganbacteria bacterium]|nr:class I SAM-dependent methyltransferase [Candidatus Saganbacteria bacterium]
MSSVNEIRAVLAAKYARVKTSGTREQREALRLAVEIIGAAQSRPALGKEVSVQRGEVRTCVFFDEVPFINVLDHRNPYLAVYYRDMVEPKGVVPNREKVTISFKAHPFTDREMELFLGVIEYLEPLFGEVNPRCKFSSAPIPIEKWGANTLPEDLAVYRQFIHPLIVGELSNLTLTPGDLVCELACGTGDLLADLRSVRPDLSYMGSDLNESGVQIARSANPGVPIHHADARDLAFLDIGTVSLFVLCGLVNESVVTKDDARQILLQVLSRAKKQSYAIITGRTPPLLKEVELAELGFFPLLATRWSQYGLLPFYVCLTPA